jgi:two-component sensor histidine kinase
MGNTNKALSILNKGLVLADSLNLMYEKMILNKEISKAYTELGNYKKALQHFQVSSELSDSIYQETANKNLVEMEQKYQSEKQKSEISQLKLNNIEQEVTIRKQKSVRNIFILGFLFAIATGYLLYRSYLSKKNANKEKEVLLKEIHHRVKNNLQIISSLLNIQSEYVTDNKIAGAVLESQSRVQAMALIHQMLYQEENLTKINFSDYLKQLTSTLASIFQTRGSEVDVTINAPDSWFNIETSIPLGLIVTELVSNAYKYAFNNNNEGKIDIMLKPLSERKYSLIISDNGKGLPEGTDILNSNSMGLKLANILTGQLNGQLIYEYNNGAVFNVEFSENRPPSK